MPTEPYLLLALADPGPALPASPPLGGVSGGGARCLNSAGRWAVRGTAQSPLLVWRPAQGEAAQAAAERASGARGHPVAVLSRELASELEGREVRLFAEAFEPALLAPAAQSAARARRLRNEADQLEAFCLVARAASAAADHAAFAQVSLAAGKALRARFGGGSITSAFAWLAGRAGREALASVLDGEVELTGPLSVREVVETLALAEKAETLRQKP